jgi:hypothetical protein
MVRAEERREIRDKADLSLGLGEKDTEWIAKKMIRRFNTPAAP